MAIKSGFVAIMGRPNIGKSTLLNTILNSKVSIVTAKSQTTRNKIQGIYNDKESQIVFMDTPGINKVHHEMEKFMNKIALTTAKAADVILFLAPVNELIGDNDRYIINALQEWKIPIILVITKIDLVSKDNLMIKIAEWKKTHNFTVIIQISALKYKNIYELLVLLKTYLEEGPQYYPDYVVTDQTEKFLIQEIIREKIMLLTEYEIPYSVAILIDKFEKKSQLLKIVASICVERNSQKGIVIGKKGRLIKEIGIQARLELEKILGTKIFLELFVKVIDKWRDKPSMIARLWYNKESY